MSSSHSAPQATALDVVSTASEPVPARLLLDVKGLTVVFGGKEAVAGVDFHVAAGEKVALVGESGSGKTVTALSLLRLLHDAEVRGQVQLAGDEGVRNLLALPEPALRAVRGREISMIFQEPMTALNPLYTVGEQIMEVLQLKLGVPRAEAQARAVALLSDTGIAQPEQKVWAYPHQLSGGQRQRAMIAMALACQPKLLLADEPTTALDVAVRCQILDLLDTLQQRRGMAVLMITHDLNLVRRFASRVIVMERGRIVEQGPVAEVFSAPRHPYTRSLIDSQPVRDVLDADPVAAPLLSAQGLRVIYPVPVPGVRGWFRRGEFVAVQGADFAIPPGHTLGVIGESGSGKSTLALAALGLLPSSGELCFDGQAWSGDRLRDRALRRRIQVVFQDPFSSLSPRLTVEEIVGEGLTIHHPSLSNADRLDKVREALEAVGLGEAQFPGLLQRYPHEFSGGQRQRLAIARALIVEPAIIVLDETTSALDVTIQKQVLQLLQRLQRERRLSYLLITHDVDVIRAMAHEVLVMQAGVIVEAGPVGQVLDQPTHSYTRTLVHTAA
ncbi:MAG: ABC transporter ATP-binding protein [Curvibacter sp.]